MRIYLAACVFSMTIGAVHAQDAPAPSEAPPLGYAARAYVDSKGCAFSRAEMNGAVLWVARRDAARQQICDESPTFAQADQGVVVTEPISVSVSPTHLHGTKTQIAGISTGVPKGYRKVWDDDRLNPNRGPRTVESDATMARVWSDDVPMKWIGN
ncbi:MAG: hypothetical protein N2B03_03195 [Boseongicola sp.]